MAKAISLVDDDFTPAPVPKAAQAAPQPIAVAAKAKEPASKKEPLQLKLSAYDAKAIKRAALEADQTVSDFMLACFHASMLKGNRPPQR